MYNGSSGVRMRSDGAKVNRGWSNPLPLEKSPAGKTEPSSKSSADKLAAHLNSSTTMGASWEILELSAANVDSERWGCELDIGKLTKKQLKYEELKYEELKYEELKDGKLTLRELDSRELFSSSGKFSQCGSGPEQETTKVRWGGWLLMKWIHDYLWPIDNILKKKYF